MEEIKDLYRKLLQKKYARSIGSIPEYKRIELLEYAQNVHTFAMLRSNGNEIADTICNWPYPLQGVKTEHKLKDYLTTSEIIIRLLEPQETEDTAAKRALIAFYNGEKIRRPKGKVTRLYQKFVHYKKDFNRTGAAQPLPEIRFRVALFQSVIKELSGDARVWAKKDLQEFEENTRNDIYFEKDLQSLKKKV